MKTNLKDLFLLPALIAVLDLMLAGLVTAQTFTTLHSFTASITNSSGVYTNSDGANPRTGLIFAGNILYGTAEVGGDSGRGALFAFKGKRGDLIKLLWWDGQGLCLFAKRLEKGRFIWPMAATGTVSLSAAQLAMLLEGIDWRAPIRSWRPELAG